MYQKSRNLAGACAIFALIGCQSPGSREGVEGEPGATEVILREKTEPTEVIVEGRGFRVETVDEGTLIRWVRPDRERELLVRGASGYEGTISPESLDLTVGGDYHVVLSEALVRIEGPDEPIADMDVGLANAAWSQAEAGGPRKLIVTRDALITPGGAALAPGERSEGDKERTESDSPKN